MNGVRSGGLLVWLAGALLALGGCRSVPEPEPGTNLNTPPDFSVEVFFDGDSDPQDAPVQRLKLVLESDRWLRVARGPGVRRETFPLRVIRLTPEQIDQLVSLVRRYHLMAEPTSPFADRTELYHGGPRAVYHVSVTMWQRTNRYATSAQESAPSAELMRTLLEMGQMQHLLPTEAPVTATVQEATP